MYGVMYSLIIIQTQKVLSKGKWNCDPKNLFGENLKSWRIETDETFLCDICAKYCENKDQAGKAHV